MSLVHQKPTKRPARVLEPTLRWRKWSVAVGEDKFVVNARGQARQGIGREHREGAQGHHDFNVVHVELGNKSWACPRAATF